LTALAGPRIRDVWELVKAGGWPMVPLLLLGVLALAIVLERFWTLRRKEVLPPGLADEVAPGPRRASSTASMSNRCAPTPRSAPARLRLDARQTARIDP
jgi:biopolymer transport protein ExbB